jgi:nucleoid-associated protein YgaU
MENLAGMMQVQVNPESYSHKTEVKYDAKQAFGTTGKQLKFAKIEPQNMEFEFLFDSTGVIPGDHDPLNGVETQLQELRELVIDCEAQQHRPRYVQLIWGTLLFNCCVNSLDISYRLFNSEGTPLRAIVRASFTGFREDNRRVAEDNFSSPDLTHVKVIREGDTLPLLCHKIYGDSKYYIEVAKINKLNNFRKLKAGEKIIFPPIRK